jgi:hypothetical protein
MVPSIVIVNNCPSVSTDEVVKVAAALQRQVIEHFGVSSPDGWGALGTVRAETADAPATDLEWVIGLFVEPDQAGALGYHDETPAGLPLAKVFPILDAQDGVTWSSTASHEILEMLADPMLSLCAQGPDAQIWAVEVCDAVESTGYEIDGVGVSNFVKPGYFMPPKNPGPKPYDYLGLVSAPLQILAGGYGQVWDPKAGWTMHDHGQRMGRTASLAGRGRTVRRRYPNR